MLQGLGLVALGVAGGALGAVAAGRLLSTLLFGVSPGDPAILIGVPARLVAIASAACLMPARRAARLDPAQILREE